MEKDSFTIFDIQLLEPGTFISDIALALACIIFYNSLKSFSTSKFHKHYTLFFLFTALSGFIGAFAHMLFLYTGKTLQFIGWFFSILSVYSFEMGVSSNILDDRKKNLFIILMRVKLVFFTLMTMVTMQFVLVKIDLVIGLLLIVLPILIFFYYKTGLKSNLYTVAGIILALIPAFLHTFRFRFNGLINMNDFSHYFLIICLFFVFIGLRGIMVTETESSI
jgi:hypothetical protein